MELGKLAFETKILFLNINTDKRIESGYASASFGTYKIQKRLEKILYYMGKALLKSFVCLK